MVFFGSSLFKIVRLFVVAAFSIHFFACLFYRVKVASFSLNVSLRTDQAKQNLRCQGSELIFGTGSDELSDAARYQEEASDSASIAAFYESRDADSDVSVSFFILIL